ncbi:hypothetical protein HYQ46_011337 [Verticillium longisporum]|nr:hypothetical protein HYQ46_011337 [Verticillium longisporum]
MHDSFACRSAASGSRWHPARLVDLREHLCLKPCRLVDLLDAESLAHPFNTTIFDIHDRLRLPRPLYDASRTWPFRTRH